MDAKATGRYLRVPPRKARLVLDAVRGKSVKDALAVLKFVPNQAARYIEKVMNSAAANAENNFSMDRDILKVSAAFVDGGPVLKRIQPRARGMANRILKRTSHITVVVTEDEKLREAAEKTKSKAKKTAKTAKPKTTAKTAAAKDKKAAKPAAEKAAKKVKEEVKAKEPKKKAVEPEDVKPEETAPVENSEEVKPEESGAVEESEKEG